MLAGHSAQLANRFHPRCPQLGLIISHRNAIKIFADLPIGCVNELHRMNFPVAFFPNSGAGPPETILQPPPIHYLPNN
jgi:hypothetical protein